MALLRALAGVWAKDSLRHGAWLVGFAVGGVAFFASRCVSATAWRSTDLLFSASAQVLVGLSVALVLGGALTERTRPLAGPLAPAVALMLLALMASLAALIPGLCEMGLRIAFSLTAAGLTAGILALVLVLTEAVGLRVSDAQWTKRLERVGAGESGKTEDRELQRLIVLAISGGVLERRRARRDIRALQEGATSRLGGR